LEFELEKGDRLLFCLILKIWKSKKVACPLFAKKKERKTLDEKIILSGFLFKRI
jgi:hypothetical protein